MVLVKPINVLFRVLTGGADVIDLITIPPLIVLTVIYGASLNPSFVQILIYLTLLINGFLIATSFYIAIIALGIVTLEIDHSVMIYRDLTNLGKLPVDIYKEPLKGFLTYIIPVGIMVTLPGRAIMGLTTWIGVITSLAAGVVFMYLSLKFWRFALTKYTSASS